MNPGKLRAGSSDVKKILPFLADLLCNQKSMASYLSGIKRA
jgi:hypothetical protein